MFNRLFQTTSRNRMTAIIVRQVFNLSLLSFLLLTHSRQAVSAQPAFRLTFDESLRAAPYSGRVYVYFSSNAEPRSGPKWFGTEPFLSLDVEEWAPGTVLELAPETDGVLTYPRDFEDVDLAGLQAQAVARFNPHERQVGVGPGNGYSEVVRIGSADEIVELEINRQVAAPTFRESKWAKLLTVHSSLLSDFHQRDVTLTAAVILPASYYDQPERRYPTMFTIPGFGGTHFIGQWDSPVNESNPGGVEFLRVMLDPSCPLGHHVFADSANNGPVGQALIEELIPAFESRFRSVAEPTARFVTGHSSGGWSSLWLQVTYPDHFGGVWSTAPDPVCFEDFQRINLYREGENMFLDAAGSRRPLARRGDQVVVWYDDFSWMEHVNGYGGQLHSFEAVFSPRGPDGRPVLLWDRETGAIDPKIAETWKVYDIRLILEQNWDSLGPQLRGKLHVFMGEKDTFYLEGATILLKESLARLGSDAVIEIQAGKDHGTLLTRRLRQRIRAEMAEAFLNAHPDTAVGE